MITTGGSTSTSTNSSIACRRRKLYNYSILSRCVILLCIQLSQRRASDVHVRAFSPSSSFINTGTHTQTLTSSVGNLGKISIATIRKNHISVSDKIHRSSSSSRENRQKSQSLQASFNEILDSEINNNDNNKSNTIQDDDEYCMPGDSCSLDHHEEEIDFLNSIPISKNSQVNPIFNPVLVIPVVTPFLAYMTYDEIARSFNALFDIIALERSWQPVDGGAYQARIIAPAINGIVVPAISILFATLTGNTVSTLRQRQIDIHTFLNTESGDLRLLSMLVDAFPGSEQKSRCREYLKQYTCRLIAESGDSKTSKVMFGSTDSEMNAFVATLNELAIYEGGRGRAHGKSSPCPPDTILSESYGAVVRLNSIRSSRITAIQSTFPVLHYGILGLLASSICLAFLLETNQELLIFLNAIQLRILWTMLIGSISALGVVCWDLSLPFTGSYIISNAVDQLKTIRDMIKATSSSV